jgi:demethylmenaquinone methyltransferase/2-methoxy-6-polyprenyl-1,4-benzoquinol methylase
MGTRITPYVSPDQEAKKNQVARMGLDVHVSGVDISAGMLEVGREKVAARGWNDRIDLIQGDSVALPFDDGHFDCFTVAFGVRNFEDLQGGLRDMLRVLKPGGLGLVLEFSKPKHFPIKQVFGLYFKYIMPTVGRWVSKDPAAYTYLPESVQAFPEGEDFLKQLREAGYVDVKAQTLTGGIATIYTGRKASQAS